MGSYKSTAAINFINAHPERRFVYITPYLDEAERITKSCPKLNFKQPVSDFKECKGKVAYSKLLLANGDNIASTHSAFKNYTREMLDIIKSKHYTVIIDESLDVLETCEFSMTDIQLFIDGGYIEYDAETQQYKATGKEYDGKWFQELAWCIRSKNIAMVETYTKTCKGVEEVVQRFYYWVLPRELVTSFDDVYVLTYLFEGQGFYYFLRMSKLPYRKIGVQQNPLTREYEFAEHPCEPPAYTKDIKSHIEVLDDDKLNAIGKGRTALSKSWYHTYRNSKVRQLKKNVYNVFRNVWDGFDSSERMYSTFIGYRDKIKGAGYAKGFVPLNMRATNSFGDKKVLAYPLNIFMPVEHKLFYQANGIEVDEDIYALSILVQWIWRAAIRKGERIHIYIPSERMRTLLLEWMDSLEKGGDEDGYAAG